MKKGAKHLFEIGCFWPQWEVPEKDHKKKKVCWRGDQSEFPQGRLFKDLVKNLPWNSSSAC